MLIGEDILVYNDGCGLSTDLKTNRILKLKEVLH